MASFIGTGRNPKTSLPQIKMPRSFYDYRGSNWFDESYFPADVVDGVVTNEKTADVGLIVAKAMVAVDATYGATYKFVPYEPGGTYGVGSDTPYGVLDVRLNVGLTHEAISVIYHGQLQERNCYVLGLAKGVISNTIKTALPDIDWV